MEYYQGDKYMHYEDWRIVRERKGKENLSEETINARKYPKSEERNEHIYSKNFIYIQKTSAE